MWSCQRCVYALATLFFAFSSANSKSRHTTITVDQSGNGDFKAIQAAIDSVPSDNKAWVCIYVRKGVYGEKVVITRDKPFIYLKGEAKRSTRVVWDAHDSIATSATFSSYANNTLVRGITFVNSYNNPPNGKNPTMPALAAMIEGDKSAFYRCGFIGYQDTLWDVQGRHYFKSCTIQGAIDFIFGAGQSQYEGCTISVVAGAQNVAPGFITAQARTEDNETNGFVFKSCKIDGNRKAYLGRPWRGHARVLFFNTSMSDIVVPQGWDAWFSVGQENQLTLAEQGSRGPGSDNLERVKWAKKLDPAEVQQLTSISFIDSDGWTRRLPFNIHRL